MQFNTHVEPWDPIKIFTRSDHIEVGIYINCSLGTLSTVTSPNILLTRNNNQFEVVFSLAQPSNIICSPIPPEFIDDVRHYFNLGNLEPGEYTLLAKYVEHDTEIPPANGVPVSILDQLAFHVAHPIPSSNLWNLLIVFMLLLIFVPKYLD